MKLIGDTYVYDNAITLEQDTYHKLNLENKSDEDFDNYVNQVATINESMNAQLKAEQERKLAEQKKLDEERAAFEKRQLEIEKENEAFINERLEVRMQLLYSLSDNKIILDYNNLCYLGKPIVSVEKVKHSPKGDWDDVLSVVKMAIAKIDCDNLELIEKIRKEEEEKAQKKVIETERLRKEQLEREAETQKQLLENATEKQKVAHYCNLLLNIETPELKTAKWQKVLSDLRFQIKNYA